MAVVQISKIQVRKGKKLQTGIPQLSGGEFAWAVDTQELYIGNGSVSEGAPLVGNTKILTEYDNILDIARAYKFASGNPSITRSVSRSIQSKLDEYVSVFDYGAIGNGTTNDTVAFQRALDDLFLNANTNFKKALFIPSGNYLISSELRIPSGANIIGESQNSTTLLMNTSTVTFKTSSNSTLGNFTGSNRPENVFLSNFKFYFTSGLLNLTGVRNAKFDNVIFESTYALGNSTETSMVSWSNDIDSTKVTDILFSNCKFTKGYIAVSAIFSAALNTIINFNDCNFYLCGKGIYLQGQANQSNQWSIQNSQFELIFNQAIHVTNGYNMSVQNSKFLICANGLNDAATPTLPVISFSQTKNNTVIDCYFDRTQEAGVSNTSSKPGWPEVQNSSKTTIINNVVTDIALSDGQRTLAVFSAFNKFIRIDYVLTLGTSVRKGVLTMIVDALSPSTISLTDEFNYTSGVTVMTGFEFGTNVFDNNLDSGLDTIQLWYRNPIANQATGTISYFVSYGV
jgi:hypothetical protein